MATGYVIEGEGRANEEWKTFLKILQQVCCRFWARVFGDTFERLLISEPN